MSGTSVTLNLSRSFYILNQDFNKTIPPPSEYKNWLFNLTNILKINLNVEKH